MNSAVLARAMFRLRCTALPVMAALAFVGSLSVPPALAQGVDGGLIMLPQESDSALPFPDIVTDISDRADPARRNLVPDDEAARGPDQSWVSALRLTDMGYRVQDGFARITGERAWVNFDLYAIADGNDAVLQIATISGINNLPERSHLRVTVNGEELGSRNLTHVEDVGVEKFRVPSGVLHTGRNRVEIEFRQQHRIFCGPEASYGLWTDIDLSRSGLLIANTPASDMSAFIGDEGFMMALAAQASGGRAVEVRGVQSLGSEAGIWRGFLVNRLNQSLSGTPLVINFTDYWTTQTGTRDLARVTIIPAAQSSVRFVHAGDGTVVMVLEVAQGTDPEQLLAGITATTPQAQDNRPALIDPEMEVPFAQFGVESEIFSERYAQRVHAFRLPDDWLVLTGAKARINLDYAFASGLPAGSALLLKINGTSVRMLPLRGGQSGSVISRYPIDFEARLMHPGTNVLGLELFVPGDPPSLPCAVNEAPVLQILDSSTLHVPYSPSMHIPDMDLAFAALSPESLRMNELSGRAYSQSDILTLGSSLARTRAGIRPSILHLISLEDLGAIPTAHYKADRALLEDILLMPAYNDAPELQAVTDNQSDPFQQRRAERRSLSLAFTTGWDALNERARWALDRIFPSSGDQLNAWLAEQRGQAVLFQLDPERPDEIWMLRAPDSDMHAIAHALVRARVQGGGPRGQAAVLTHDGQWESWLAPDRRPTLLEPWSHQNFRAAMGNVVSARPVFYTLLMLGMATLSALVALRLVISTREDKT
jgi:hypothetical protein